MQLSSKLAEDGRFNITEPLYRVAVTRNALAFQSCIVIRLVAYIACKRPVLLLITHKFGGGWALR